MEVAYIGIIIASISALISLGSFIFNWWTTIRAMEPHLNASKHVTRASFTYSLCNKGGGPAKVEGIEYFFQEHSVELDKLIERLSEKLDSMGISYGTRNTAIGCKSVIASGESIEILHIATNSNDISLWEKVNEYANIRIILRYKSVHGGTKVFDSDE